MQTNLFINIMSGNHIIKPVTGLLFCICLLAASSRPKPHEVPPEKALATFQLPEGFQIEMVASEPLVADPVAMEIDEAGRMYVVEMHGYPLDKSGSGKIKLLTDTDGDGKMDKSIAFAEGLMLPTGVMRWKKGIIVTDAPNVLYLEDSDGDGKADLRDTLVTGFALSNPQHNLNNPTLGLDNWIYLGHEPAVSTQTFKSEFGDRGGDVYYPDKKETPRLPDNARGRSVRMRPDRAGLEILSANTQFGHTFDNWGRYLLVSNANHIIHQVMSAEYLKRNPNLLVSNAAQSISDHGNAAEVFPITQNPLNQLLTDLGVFTSACGSKTYQGGIFPAPFDSVMFVAEPVSNIVHADVIHDKGATFTASRVYQNKEFLASTDAWFRPVNMYIGPDGALYVVDYYRQIIEHPEWMADDVIKSGELYNGIDKGRIYRITPKGTKPLTWVNDLKTTQWTNDFLVGKLADPNIWWRRNAQRLLIDGDDKTVVASLEQMVANEKNPLGRLHALYTLEGMNALKPELLVTALKDNASGVRENAIRLSEPFLKDNAVQNALISLQNDPNAKVRFQLLCTLGFLDSPEAGKARENLLFKNIEDPWMQIAALSATPSSKNSLLGAVLNRYQADNAAYSSLVERLSTMTGNGGSAVEIKNAIMRVLAPEDKKNSGWQAAVLQGLALGLKNNKTAAIALKSEQNVLVSAAINNPSAAVRQGSIQLLNITGLIQNASTKLAVEKSVRTALDKKASVENRTAAINFLSLDNPKLYIRPLKKLIAPTEPLPVQLAALKTLSAVPDNTVSHFVVEQWPSLTRDVRNAAINTFMVNESRISLLLDALEKKIIDPSAIGWPRSVGLMAQGNAALKARSRMLLTKKDDGRMEVVKAYAPALSMTGSIDNGRAVFQKNCSACHQIGGKSGTPYGPDLGTIRNRRPESIMGDILNPNLSIADGFDIWSIEIKEGEPVQGLIATESPTALTIRNYGGQETVIARANIKSLKALGMSVMPAGLENQISRQEMADLLLYLKQGKQDTPAH
ncbi:c-type cytochrome [Dyadobacter chenwenxiniae]|uniref:C-type cytochrome n=1 Tax=Dyadobacter chenwenxiniae TaxID=2906456 RepID=A0A9X1PG01_9BACT|nr:PVC-type heme-binding CxxCH protein [Dyadobacter chenwenxiniae]MCF0060435.1 c-type cytochrome [Dyadobacter chenwenxiniae]UON86166.1 c-type cytochrome [Dyadobacter chenwenxiniae]